MDKITFIVKTIHEYCTSHNVPYVIVGGFSVLVFGRSRMTMDIDVIIDHKKLNYDDFVKHFKNQGFDINRSDLEALDEQIHGSFFEKDTMYRIDIKGVYSENERQSIEQAVLANFNGIEAVFDNPNQLIVHKLKFGSEQDYEDAVAVFYRSKSLIDLQLLSEFAKNLGMESELKQFLEDNPPESQI